MHSPVTVFECHIDGIWKLHNYADKNVYESSTQDKQILHMQASNQTLKPTSNLGSLYMGIWKKSAGYPHCDLTMIPKSPFSFFFANVF